MQNPCRRQAIIITLRANATTCRRQAIYILISIPLPTHPPIPRQLRQTNTPKARSKPARTGFGKNAVLFEYNRLGAEGSSSKHHCGSKQTLSCALPRVPHLGTTSLCLWTGSRKAPTAWAVARRDRGASAIHASMLVIFFQVMEGEHTQHAQATRALTLHAVCV
jgi:hypothetical protein